MTLRHLKIFVTVAECGKMRKAAEILYISQPSVSQAIAELERHYGVRLFERLSQKIYLTDTGRMLLGYARRVVTDFETLDRAMKFAASQPVVRLGGSVSVGTRFFVPLACQVRHSMPHLDLHVDIDNTEAIEKRLLQGELDAAVVEGFVHSNELVRQPLVTDELVIVAGKKHPFAQRDAIALEELNGQSYIAREDGSTQRNQYELLLLERGVHMEQKWSSTNMEPIKKAVAAGSGLAILSTLVIQKELQDKTLCVVPVQGVHVARQIQLIYHKDKFLFPQMEEFLALVKQAVAQQGTV